MNETCETCAHHMPDGMCLIHRDWGSSTPTTQACNAYVDRSERLGREIAANWYMAREWGIYTTGLWKGRTENYGDKFRKMLSDLLSCAYELRVFVELDADTATLYDKLDRIAVEAMLIGVGPDEDFEDWLDAWAGHLSEQLGIEVD